MLRTLASYIHSEKKQIVLTVAMSEIAKLLLPRGQMVHSKYKIPTPPLESSSCDIDKRSDCLELIKVAKLSFGTKLQHSHVLF